ncbi:sulfurtransferase complex subunit TusD [Candidatus Profftia sp. (ex Adelges kitamiensis)]|uniref:sulfurtransferase complex subunit TusD n=1 Tax=Candidatus Profftia sp. (ex Adelges kitamiensis) TaxID=2864218 RepID=UPI001CE2DD14|nr:sulfurtransferase complex subunit TusD [Candidatus Profftia sp. (ex Adelges kitamiensis)]
MLIYSLLVTGPAYGTQAASSAYQFAQAIIVNGYRLMSVFFYREGVYNANILTSTANNECNLVREWQNLAQANNIILNVCIAAALRRGVISHHTADEPELSFYNSQDSCFIFSGLGSLAEAILNSDRVIQF